jgi:hypothetical protein
LLIFASHGGVLFLRYSVLVVLLLLVLLLLLLLLLLSIVRCRRQAFSNFLYYSPLSTALAKLGETPEIRLSTDLLMVKKFALIMMMKTMVVMMMKTTTMTTTMMMMIMKTTTMTI